VAPQRGVGRDPLGHREVGVQVRHHIGRGSHGDLAVLRRARAPLEEPAGVQAVGAGPDLPLDLLVTPARQQRGDLGVDLRPVLRAEEHRLADQDRRPALVDRAGGERVGAVRHLRERVGETQEGVAPVRGLAPGERDLGGDTTALVPGRHSCGRLLGALRGVERDRDPGLGGGGSGLDRLEGAQEVDALAVRVRALPAAEALHEQDQLGSCRHRVLHWSHLSVTGGSGLIERVFDSR
jgi:hypothetical protein